MTVPCCQAAFGGRLLLCRLSPASGDERKLNAKLVARFVVTKRKPHLTIELRKLIFYHEFW
jgi:hypothetical protein